MTEDDSERRIAELERQLAEVKAATDRLLTGRPGSASGGREAPSPEPIVSGRSSG